MKSLSVSGDRPRVILAPMAGVTDSAYRALMTRYGADLTYTEMVSAAGLHYDNKRTWEMVDLIPDESAVGVQLFGHDPLTLGQQALRIENLLGSRLAVIDINMACPVKKVLKNGDGSALLKDPQRAASIVAEVKNQVTCPVSVKMRIGFQAGDNLGLELARCLAHAGVDALAIHGRTAQQLYKKTSSHAQVGAIFDDLNKAGFQRIIKMVSGDIFSPEQAKEAHQITGADAILVARGSQGNPFIFSQIKELLDGNETYRIPTLKEKLDAAQQHCELFFAYRGHIPRLRKLLSWYLSGLPHASALRARCSTISTKADVQDILTAAYESLEVLARNHELSYPS